MVFHMPRHIAVIMDGNGRWGKLNGLSRSEGHYAGVQAMETIIDKSMELGVEALTLYAFSTENWSRATEEVNYLMFLPIKFFQSKLPEFMRRNIRITVAGNLDRVPDRTRIAIERAVGRTSRNSGMVVNFAFNYGGRDEIVQATKRLALDVLAGRMDGATLSEDEVADYLYTASLPTLDLMIRTGGEQRISNFLLWQMADAELYFSEALFPDFDGEALEKAVLAWQRACGYTGGVAPNLLSEPMEG